MSQLNGKGISFSFSMKPQSTKGKMNVNIGAFQKVEKKSEKIRITEVVDNAIKEEQEEKPELIIPVKQPSWIAKAKQRVEREKVEMKLRQQQKEETSEGDHLDEARRAILKDLYKSEDNAEGDPNLVIPLHDKSKDGSGKPQPMILRNRMPGYDTMNKDDYFKMELDSLPEANDAHSDLYNKVRIEDFGRAVLRGMGWDGKNNVNASVYEIKPRPDRLGLGAMPIALDKNQRKSALKKSVLDKALEKNYSGVKNEWGKNNELRVGLQVGIIRGGLKGKQGMIIETPKPNASTLKILIDGEKQVHLMNLSDLMILSDLVKVQSFNNQYGSVGLVKSSTNQSGSVVPSQSSTNQCKSVAPSQSSTNQCKSVAPSQSSDNQYCTKQTEKQSTEPKAKTSHSLEKTTHPYKLDSQPSNKRDRSRSRDRHSHRHHHHSSHRRNHH